jgi:hypothetical protein
MKEKLEEAIKKYKDGMWIISPNGIIKEPLLVRGKIKLLEHFYGIGSEGMGCIYNGKTNKWAKIVEEPKTSTIYKL